MEGLNSIVAAFKSFPVLASGSQSVRDEGVIFGAAFKCPRPVVFRLSACSAYHPEHIFGIVLQLCCQSFFPHRKTSSFYFCPKKVSGL